MLNVDELIEKASTIAESAKVWLEGLEQIDIASILLTSGLLATVEMTKEEMPEELKQQMALLVQFLIIEIKKEMGKNGE